MQRNTEKCMRYPHLSMHAWSKWFMQKYCLVLFCRLNTESKRKWLINVYRQHCSKYEKFETVAAVAVRVSLESGILFSFDWKYLFHFAPCWSNTVGPCCCRWWLDNPFLGTYTRHDRLWKKNTSKALETNWERQTSSFVQVKEKSWKHNAHFSSS